MRPDSDAAEAYFKRFQRSKAVFVVGLACGFRFGDLVSLRWSSIDFTSNGGIVTITTKKTGASVTLPMSNFVRDALRACLGCHDEFVFVAESGAPYDRSTLRRYFSKTKKIAGIARRFRWHDMRHCFGTKLARSNAVAATTIRDAMGHRSVRTSERYARRERVTRRRRRHEPDSNPP